MGDLVKLRALVGVAGGTVAVPALTAETELLYEICIVKL